MPKKRNCALTAKEKEVAALVAQGLKNAEIAAHFGVTENTVKVHLRNIFRKTECRNRAELAVKQITARLDQGS